MGLLAIDVQLLRRYLSLLPSCPWLFKKILRRVLPTFLDFVLTYIFAGRRLCCDYLGVEKTQKRFRRSWMLLRVVSAIRSIWQIVYSFLNFCSTYLILQNFEIFYENKNFPSHCKVVLVKLILPFPMYSLAISRVACEISYFIEAPKHRK